jgi:hypothetical protein
MLGPRNPHSDGSRIEQTEQPSGSSDLGSEGFRPLAQCAIR